MKEVIFLLFSVLLLVLLAQENGYVPKDLGSASGEL